MLGLLHVSECGSASGLCKGKDPLTPESIYDERTIEPTTGELSEGWGRVPGGMLTKVSEQIFWYPSKRYASL
jgi:hypothetical protein